MIHDLMLGMMSFVLCGVAGVASFFFVMSRSSRRRRSSDDQMAEGFFAVTATPLVFILSGAIGTYLFFHY